MTIYGLVYDKLQPVAVPITARRTGAPGFTITGMSAEWSDWMRPVLRHALRTVDVDVDGVEVTVGPVPSGCRTDSLSLAVARAVLALEDAPLPAGGPPQFFAGEIGQFGDVQAVRGLRIMLCGAAPGTSVFVPASNYAEAAACSGLTVGASVYLVSKLSDFLRDMSGHKPVAFQAPSAGREPSDFSDFSVAERTLRAIEIAAAGKLPLLLVGGRRNCATLARCFTSVLPVMHRSEIEAVSSIFSATGLLPEQRGAVTTRPWRAPHPTTSIPGLVGSYGPTSEAGAEVPGEVSLAHHGVLYLGDLMSFRGSALEVISTSVAAKETPSGWPSDALVLGGVQACPCGEDGELCKCSTDRQVSWDQRMERFYPFVLRVDLAAGDGDEAQVIDPLVVDDHCPDCAEFEAECSCPTDSDELRKSVSAARRFGDQRDPLEGETTHVQLVARAIADLAGSHDILDEHVVEARTFAITGGWS